MGELENYNILIAEDHALVRQGLAALLELEGAAVTQAGDGETAMFLLKSQSFDLVVLDIGLPRRTGIDVMREARARQLSHKIIILTGDTDTHSPDAMLEAGADGFVYKTANADEFLNTVMTVMKGALPTGQVLTNGAQAESVAQLRERLTPRELQIVKLICEGSGNKDAAQALSISEHTVRKHREHINKKLNINTPLALAAFAVKAGLTN